MPWFKVDDTLHGHPKAHDAGLAAIGLWTLAGSYCSQYVTEGHVPAFFVTGWRARKLADRLAAMGLWHECGHACECCPQPRDPNGWVFHDWEHYQQTKEEIERDRTLNRERQKKFREKRREARADAVRNEK
jgi:hypothetical protein